MSNEDTIYKFCATNDEDTLQPMESVYGQVSTTWRKRMYGLRNKTTGMVCFPSTYSNIHTITEKSAYIIGDGLTDRVKSTRKEVTLRSSDSDVNMGIQYIFKATRTTADDWEVVKYNVKTPISEHSCFSTDSNKQQLCMPYLSGYNGSHPYRTYDASLFDVPRDVMMLFDEGTVVESEDWTEASDSSEHVMWTEINSEIEVI